MRNKNIKEFFLYFIVAAVATVTEWVIFYLLGIWNLWHYFISAVIAHMLATFVNWAAGRLLVFKESQNSLIKEILQIYAASTVGLILNLIIMFVAVEFFSIGQMLSKIIATAIVFAFNFLVREKYIYKKSKN